MQKLFQESAILLGLIYSTVVVTRRDVTIGIALQVIGKSAFKPQQILTK